MRDPHLAFPEGTSSVLTFAHEHIEHTSCRFSVHPKYQLIERTSPREQLSGGTHSTRDAFVPGECVRDRLLGVHKSLPFPSKFGF